MNRRQRRMEGRQAGREGGFGRQAAAGHGMDERELLGSALRLIQAGRLPEAEANLRRALAADPDNVDGLHLLGVVAAKVGRCDAAVELIGRAVRIKPDFAEAHYNLGRAFRDLGALDEAAACYRRVTALRPDFAEAHYNLGNALRDKGQAGDAIASYRRALALKPDYAEAHYNLGLALQEQCRPEDAIAAYRRALEIRPDYTDALNNLGNAHLERGAPDEAAACYRRILDFKPDFAGSYHNLALAFEQQGKLDEALAAVDRALAIQPDFADARKQMGILRLQRGEFAQGWRDYEARWGNGRKQLTPRRYAQPEWRGEDLAGRTILLYPEQGFGDILQFARYAAVVAGRGGRVILEVPRALARLMTTCPGVSEIVTSGDKAPAFECHLPLMSVARVVGTTLETIPAELPYLGADPGLAAAWRQRLGGLPGLKVGLAWAGDPRPYHHEFNAIDRRRSIALNRLAPLLALPGTSFISLQKDDPAAQIAGLPAALRPLDLMAEIGDFADTAALIANLDLVISVDTSVVHLAGAMAKPVWILSRFDGCWRWLLHRDDSSWYPTARLFRQTMPQAWEPVIAGMAEKLAEVAAGRLPPVWPLADPAA